MNAINAARKNVNGGKFLKTSAVAKNAINAMTVALVKDVTGGNFGKIDAVYTAANATNVVINTFNFQAETFSFRLLFILTIFLEKYRFELFQV